MVQYGYRYHPKIPLLFCSWILKLVDCLGAVVPFVKGRLSAIKVQLELEY